LLKNAARYYLLRHGDQNENDVACFLERLADVPLDMVIGMVTPGDFGRTKDAIEPGKSRSSLLRLCFPPVTRFRRDANPGFLCALYIHPDKSKEHGLVSSTGTQLLVWAVARFQTICSGSAVTLSTRQARLESPANAIGPNSREYSTLGAPRGKVAH
jgi:hypothetical protein